MAERGGCRTASSRGTEKASLFRTDIDAHPHCYIRGFARRSGQKHEVERCSRRSCSPLRRPPQKQTVCTITVNSPDERDVFRRHLPGTATIRRTGRERQPRLACRLLPPRRALRRLLVSGHFAGTRVLLVAPQCRRDAAGGCDRARAWQRVVPGLFDQLKEVHLFGATPSTQSFAGRNAENGVRLQREGRPPEEATRRAASCGAHGESAARSHAAGFSRSARI